MIINHNNKNNPITTDEVIDFYIKNQELETWDEFMACFETAKQNILLAELPYMSKDLKALIDILMLNEFNLVKYLNDGYIHSQWNFGLTYVTILKRNIYQIYNIETKAHYYAKTSDLDLLITTLTQLT